MDLDHLATTQDSAFEACGAGGYLAPQVWRQLSDHLGRCFGKRHADLLAEPQPDPATGVTDWYGPAGHAAVLQALPEVEREHARTTLVGLVADIESEVKRLCVSRSQGDRLLGALLDLAMIIPSPDCLRVVAGQPVLVAWGHARSGEAPKRALLQDQLRPPPRPPATASLPAGPLSPESDADRARGEGGRTGRIQIILAWDDVNDLDLSVICPGDERIDFAQKQACGGVLDVDRNAGVFGPTPVENIVFESEPPAGAYAIEVKYFKRNPGGPAISRWRVTLRRAGRADEIFRGALAENSTASVATFLAP